MSNTYAWVAKPKDRYIVYGGITGNEVRHRINGGYRFPQLDEKVRKRHINLLHDEEVDKPWRNKPDDKTPRWMYLMNQFTEQTIINTCRKVADDLEKKGIDVVCGNVKNAVSQYDGTEFANWINNQRHGEDYNKDLYGKITDFIEGHCGELKAKRQDPAKLVTNNMKFIRDNYIDGPEMVEHVKEFAGRKQEKLMEIALASADKDLSTEDWLDIIANDARWALKLIKLLIKSSAKNSDDKKKLRATIKEQQEKIDTYEESLITIVGATKKYTINKTPEPPRC